MKKIFVLGLIGMFISAQAFAGQGKIQDALSDTGTTIVVTNDASVYGKTFKLASSSEVGLWIKGNATTSTANPCSFPNINGCGNNNLKVELEMSYNDSAANFANPIGVTPIINSLVASTPTVVLINSTLPMAYGRFKLTNSSATYDTVVSMKFFSRDL